ncbi:unnamed protein product, partial [Iphiclides podalirius]
MEYRHRLPCFLLLGVWACVAVGRVVVGPGHLSDELDSRVEITDRCSLNSKTDVSCSEVGEDRLMPHPDDCHLFYQCALDWAVCRECPHGLHFNPTEHVCDRPENAHCALSTVSTTTPSTTVASPPTTTRPSTTRDPLTTFVTLH